MTTTATPERERSSIAEKYIWNLADLFPTAEDWRTERTRVAAALPALGAWKGTLTTSARGLADALEKRSELRRAVIRLYVYAEMLSDQDTRESVHQGMTQ